MTFSRALLRLHPALNRRALPRAGRGSLADVEHVGRRSGTVRHTPVRAFRSGDTVVVGVNFGNRSDWVRNILAAGGCRMHLRGHDLDQVDPRLVPVAEGARGMPWWFGLGLRFVVRTRECLELRVATDTPRTPARRPG